MELIIAGSRSLKNYNIEDAIEESPFTIGEVSTLIHGDAEGVDTSAKNYFKEIETVSVESYPYEDFLEEAPNAKVAPLIRNTKMAKEADALLAIWDGESDGTKDMIDKARKHNLELHIHRPNNSTFDDFM